jgi:hypothetical protein
MRIVYQFHCGRLTAWGPGEWGFYNMKAALEVKLPLAEAKALLRWAGAGKDIEVRVTVEGKIVARYPLTSAVAARQFDQHTAVRINA